MGRLCHRSAIYLSGDSKWDFNISAELFFFLWTNSKKTKQTSIINPSLNASYFEIMNLKVILHFNMVVVFIHFVLGP